MSFGNCKRLAGIAALVLAVVELETQSANGAPHELIYALSYSGDAIVSFWSDNPGQILQSSSIVGLGGGTHLAGIDSWQGQVYGLNSRGEIYLIDPATGQAQSVGNNAGNAPLRGTAFGFQNTPAGMRIVSDLDINQNICRTTGRCSLDPVLEYASGDIFSGTSPNVASLAYDSRTDSIYALDYLRQTLARLDPATGLLSTLTPAGIGIDLSRYNGFEISSDTGVGYIGSAGDGDPQSSLYSLNLATGEASLIGLIGPSGDGMLVRGLTVATSGTGLSDFSGQVAIPEPGTLPLLWLAVAGWLGMRTVRRG